MLICECVCAYYLHIIKGLKSSLFLFCQLSVNTACILLPAGLIKRRLNVLNIYLCQIFSTVNYTQANRLNENKKIISICDKIRNSLQFYTTKIDK